MTSFERHSFEGDQSQGLAVLMMEVSKRAMSPAPSHKSSRMVCQLVCNDDRLLGCRRC